MFPRTTVNATAGYRIDPEVSVVASGYERAVVWQNAVNQATEPTVALAGWVAANGGIEIGWPSCVYFRLAERPPPWWARAVGWALAAYVFLRERL